MNVFNCSTNIVGGAVQNAVNFIKEIVDNGCVDDWYFILSNEVYLQVKDIININFSVFESPARNFRIRNDIFKLVEDISPRLVYTSAGPAYIDFKCIHIMGCSNPYVLGATKRAIKLLGGKRARLKRYLLTLYQRFYIRKADYWIVQTVNSVEGLRSLGCDVKRISVVNNALASSFYDLAPLSIERESSKRNVLIPSAYYNHKDLDRVPIICSEYFKRFGRDITFTFTMNDSDFDNIIKIAKVEGTVENIKNIGPFKHSEALSIYQRYDLIFQPSVLEVFSTTYLEAIAIFKPLVVPRLNFAIDICGDYASYYNVDDVADCAAVINSSLVDFNFTSKDVFRTRILKKYGTQRERFNKMINLINEIKSNV
jgi:hypothetical protein